MAHILYTTVIIIILLLLCYINSACKIPIWQWIAAGALEDRNMADQDLQCGLLIVGLLLSVVVCAEAGTIVQHNITWSANVSKLYPPR